MLRSQQVQLVSEQVHGQPLLRGQDDLRLGPPEIAGPMLVRGKVTTVFTTTEPQPSRIIGRSVSICGLLG